MIPSVLLATAQTPDGKELRLYQHDKDFSIKIGTVELMSSRMHSSEDSLAQLAYKGMSKTHLQPRVLIGGLGMGYTLRAMLERLPRDAQVSVAELVPAVVEWNRTLLADLARRPLEDKRVTVREEDVAKIIKKARNEYSAILLDVDNGPQGLAQAANDWLYNYKGLYAAFAALQPEGVLAVWSARRDDAFARRLRAVGYYVNEFRVRAHAGKGAHHLVWIAKKAEALQAGEPEKSGKPGPGLPARNKAAAPPLPGRNLKPRPGFRPAASKKKSVEPEKKTFRAKGLRIHPAKNRKEPGRKGISKKSSPKPRS